MSVSKPEPMKIFLSHVNEEAELAAIVQRHIYAAFDKRNVTIYSFSDSESVLLGEEWLKLKPELVSSKVVIVLCSSVSIERPWINIEAGYAWLADRPTLLLCHTDLKVSDLPMPYKGLLSGSASDPKTLQRMYATISTQRGSAMPAENFDSFAQEVRVFEREYGEVGRVREVVKKLIGLSPEFRELFQTGIGAGLIRLTEYSHPDILRDLDTMQLEGVFEVSTPRGPHFPTGGGGPIISRQFTVTDKYRAMVADIMKNI